MVSPSQKRFLRSVGTHIGTIIGVGVFGLPFVFHQAGPIVGLIELTALVIMTIVITLMYAEITLQTPGKHRFVSYMGQFLGPIGRQLATIVYILALLGSFIAFTIVGAKFLNILLPVIPAGLAALLVAGIAGAFAWGGIRFVAKAEVGVVALILLLYTLIILVALPHAQLSTLLVWSSNPMDIIVPYGVIFFALGGLSAIPVMHDILGRDSKQLPKVILTSLTIIGVLYAAFALVVVAASGSHTSADALSGLAFAVNPAVIMVGTILGLISILSIFTESGIQFIETLHVDLKTPRFLAWLIAFALPATLYLLGVHQFVDVVDFVGSVIGGATGILVVFAYEKMKSRPTCQPGHCWRVPSFVSWIIVLAFVLGIVAQVVYTISK